MSLVPPQPQVWPGFSDVHHCSFLGGRIGRPQCRVHSQYGNAPRGEGE